MSHPASIPSRTYALWPILISRPAEDRRLRLPVKPPRLITKVMSPYEDGHSIRYDTILTFATHLVWPLQSENPPGSADESMKKPILVSLILFNYPLKALMLWKHLPRYDTRWYFNVRSKVDTSQLNLRLSNNKKVRKKLKSKNGGAQKYRRTDRGIRGVSREDGHHLSTNRARRRTTSLIRPTTLALRHATPLPLATEWHCIP